MKRNLLVLAGLLVVLFVIYLIFSTSEQKSLSGQKIHDFFWADSNLIDSMAIKYGQWSYLYLEGGHWQMVVDEELTYPAAYNEVSNVIRTTNEMVLTDLISINPAKRAKFKVDTNSATVIRFFSKGEVLSDFLLGPVGQDFTHTYVRRQGSDSVWLAKGRFASIYSKAPPQWMDRQVFNFGPDELAEIRWVYPDEETRLMPGPDGQYLVSRDPDFTPVPADSAEAAYKFNYISQLIYSAFLPAGREGEADFTEPILHLTAIDTTGASRELIFCADAAAENPNAKTTAPSRT